ASRMPQGSGRSDSAAELGASGRSLKAAQALGAGDAVDGDDVGRAAEVDLALLVDREDLLPGLFHALPELAVHLLLVPEELLEVLHPLQVRHGDAAVVDQDVRRHDDAALGELLVGAWRGRRVRRFEDEARLDRLAILTVDDAAESGGDQEVAGEGQKGLVRHLLALAEALDAP